MMCWVWPLLTELPSSALRRERGFPDQGVHKGTLRSSEATTWTLKTHLVGGVIPLLNQRPSLQI